MWRADIECIRNSKYNEQDTATRCQWYEYFTLRRCWSIARLNQVDSVNIISPLEANQHHVEEGESEQVNMPEEFRVPINELL